MEVSEAHGVASVDFKNTSRRTGARKRRWHWNRFPVSIIGQFCIGNPKSALSQGALETSFAGCGNVEADALVLVG